MACPHRSVSQIALDCFQRQHVVLGLIFYFVVSRSPAYIWKDVRQSSRLNLDSNLRYIDNFSSNHRRVGNWNLCT